MTRAPANLLTVRQLLLTHLDMQPGRVVDADLDPAEVGIVGDAAHIGEGDSYHLGIPEQNPRGSYSVLESTRDRALTDLACALDVGTFSVATPTDTYGLPHFSKWSVEQCEAGAPDTRDIREIIYSPDGRVVRRWDRLKRRSSGDTSHLWHTHFSFFRDAIKAGRDQTPLFRRYLATIGLLEDDMPLTETDAQLVARAVVNQTLGRSDVTVGMVLQGLPTSIAALGDDDQDPAAIADAIVSALPPELAKQVAAELAARLAS